MEYLNERNGRHWLLWTMVLFFSLFFSTSTIAAVTEMVKDLQPLEGYVVLAQDNEFIIDLDKTANIAIGDVFSVIEPGKKLLHPVTNEVIGRLEEVKGVLRVVRLADGYSFARPIGSAEKIERGDPIHRFSGLKAVFWDYTDEKKPLFIHLRNALPELKWMDYRLAQKNRPQEPFSSEARGDTIYFVVHSDKLEVLDGEFISIHQYSLDASEETKMSSTPAATKKTERDTAVKTAAPLPSKKQESTASKETSLVDYGVAEATIRFPESIVMADLLQRDGGSLLATTNGKKISVFSVDTGLQLIASAETKSFADILAVKWWTPAENTPPYLAVLAWDHNRIDSTIYSLKDGDLKKEVGGLKTILGSFDLDGDGFRETLLSQKFEAENFFGRRIQQLYWKGSELQYKDPTIELPPKFNVIGGELADLTGDSQLEAAYVRNGELSIYSGKKRIYVSPQHMGGSLSVLTYKVDPEQLDYRTTSVFFEVAPVAVDIDGDGRKELLTVSSDQSSFRIPGVISTVDSSRIVVFDYKDGGFTKGTLGPQMEAAVQGLDVADRKLLVVMTESGQSGGEGVNSRLQAIDLAF